MINSLNILIVDDNPDDRELCKRLLLKSLDKKVTTTEASSGDQSLELLEQFEFHCVLLDYSLPGRNGIEVLKRIRSKNPHLPVVMLTGQGNESIAVLAMKQGAQDYIVKSELTSEVLNHHIKTAIEHCQLKKHIDQQQQALNLFTRALAHDLTGPLRTIQSYIKLTKEESQGAERDIYLGRALIAAENMDKLIQTVRSYTELSNESDIQKSECDLNEVVKSALTNLDELIQSKKGVVKHGPLPKIYGNEVHLLQLFQNLIGNAIQYSDQEKPEVEIGFEETDRQFRFYVRDNGAGIPESYWSIIFEPFKRLSTSKRGSGLGLSICRKIVERHGGKIWVDSSRNGTTFYFTLEKVNFKKDETAKVDVKSVNEYPVDAQFANVLLVDDSIDDAFLTRFFLIQKGKMNFNLYSVYNGKEAIDFLKNSAQPKIDLVLLDVNMPVMDGFEFLRCRQLDQQLQNTPVIICSTSEYEKDRQVASGLGAADYIIKPISKQKFVGAVDKISSLRITNEGSDVVALRCVVLPRTVDR